VRIALALLAPLALHAQDPVDVAPDAARWLATDSVRAESYLGRPAIYIDRGVALVRGADLRRGTLELDVAASPRTSFLGVVFHAESPTRSEAILLRPNDSGNPEAVQYSPALNGVAGAWQVYHGDGYNASTELPRERWIHVRVDMSDSVAAVYVNGAEKPTLLVPRLAGTSGGGLGLWAGAYGRGAYFSNVRYSSRPAALPAPPPPAVPDGTLVDWEITDAFDGAALTPLALPRLDTLRWQRVHAEAEGFVLVNRYRVAPNSAPPFDRATRTLLVDSLMHARVPGSRVVLARTTITSAAERTGRLHVDYSDGAVVYLNGRPLFLGMDPQGLHDNGYMRREGQVVFAPLRKGRNELVIASIEYTGGWAFAARLEP